MFLKLIISDLRNNFIFFSLLIFNFTLGLTGFVALDSFKVGIQKAVKANAKEYLSADLTVSARRLLTDREVQIAKIELTGKGATDSFQESRMVEMFTMVNTPAGSRLVQLKIVDDQYPFYGQLKLQNHGAVIYGTAKDINSDLKAWAYSDLFTQLNLKLGATIKLGNLEFVLSDRIIEDSTQALRLTSLAPKIYIGLQNLKALGLIEMGSTLTETRLYKIHPSQNLEELKKNLFRQYIDPAIQVQSPQDAQEESGRVMGYLNDYLGLVSLVGFFLAMIGSTYLYRSFLNARVKAVAIMNALGLSFHRALGIYITQLLIAAFISAFLSVILAGATIPIIQKVLGSLMAIKVDAVFQSKSVGLALAVSILGVLFSCLPYLVSINRIPTSQLLQESSRMVLPLNSWDFIYFIPLLLLFYFLSVFQSNSLKIGSMFFAGLLLSFMVVFGIAHLFLALFRRLSISKSSVSLKQAILLISRNTSQSLPAIMALAMAALLINLIPQLKAGLLNEFSLNKEAKLPGLFLFDIQDEQLSDLKELVNSFGVSFTHVSPMVRARIISVNGQSFEKSISESTSFKTREEEVEARFRNRGFNLSYRDHLSAAEKIIEGKFDPTPWKENSGKSPGISVEKRFADRLGFKLGDILKFDVQGSEVTGQITSFRSVRWNSFQPNFFILFQPRVLDEAPKSWLASLPQTDSQLKFSLQESISKKFFNISSVDIEKVTHRILQMINQMSWAIQFMSMISLVAGLFVIFSISSEQSQIRQWDLYLMRVLGAMPNTLLMQNFYENLFLGIFSSLVGVLLSFIMAYVLSYYLFDALFVPDFFWMMVSIAIVTFFTILVSLVTSRLKFSSSNSKDRII